MVKTEKKTLFSTVAIFLFFVVISVLLMAGEWSLRLSRKFENYYERNGELWAPENMTEVLAEPWLWINPKNGMRLVEKTEYRQVFHFGTEGFSGETLPLEKQKDECRIIIVGDSFTQGFGDVEGQGMVSRLKKTLDQQHYLEKPFSVMNAGIGGSDPVFEFELISRVLLKYKPSFIFVVINYSDIQDLKRRGGFDRFSFDGKLKTSLPWWTWAYHRSHLFRAFAAEVLGYDANLTSTSESGISEMKAIDGVIEAVSKMYQLANQNSYQLLVLLHPLQFELEEGHLASSLLNVKESLLKKSVDVVDLTYQFQKLIPVHAEKLFFWKLDGHYNPKGYDVFASAIEAELRKAPRGCLENLFIRNEH